VVLGEAESIPLPDASVDYLFSTEVIEHVQSPERMMQEVSRVLKPDGAAFITTTTYQFIIFHYIWLLPNLKRGYGDLADYLLGYFSKGKRDGFVRLLYDFTGGHLWGFLKKDLVRLAGRGDLEVEDVYYLNVQPLLPFTLQGGGVRRMLRKVVETVNGAFLHKRRAVYGPNIVLKLRKPATC
jgi:SAM-dependent methyltransferase